MQQLERTMQASISVVVPVYGCAACVGQLCERLTRTLSDLTDRFEIILVDDRSPDGSWAAIEKAQLSFPRVKGLRLSRNFGQHVAISAGLAESRGDFVVVMDCDLQDPPECIPALLVRIREGYDLVLARRKNRKHSLFRRMAAKAYSFFARRMNRESFEGSFGTLSILSRKVVLAFLEFSERERHYLFILNWLGFHVGTIDYEQAERASGKSSYSLARLMNHAYEGVFFQSTAFLKWIVSIGLLFSASGALLAVTYTYRYFVYGSVAGWTSVVVLLLICTGVIVVSMGVIGLYVGKIFDQSKARPLFVIDIKSEPASDWK